MKQDFFIVFLSSVFLLVFVIYYINYENLGPVKKTNKNVFFKQDIQGENFSLRPCLLFKKKLKKNFIRVSKEDLILTSDKGKEALFKINVLKNGEITLIAKDLYYVSIDYEGTYKKELPLSLKKSPDNSSKLKIYYKKNYGYYFKFFNGYYLALDTSSSKLVSSKEYNNILFFSIDKIIL